MSTYREIRALSSQLGSTKLTERRVAGERLQSMLSLPEVRRKLKQEAKGGHRALAEMWRYIILKAIVSVQSLAKSKNKMQLSDIIMPYKLVVSCGIPDHDDALAYEPSKLSRKEAKLVFTYCYEMLQDERALELAKRELLDFMRYICTRRTFVAYMRPHQEMHAVLQEVEKRILPGGEHFTEMSNEEVGAAGLIWENLIVTSTRSLGIGLHLLMPGCFRIVALWCETNLTVPRINEDLIGCLFRGFAALIESDLEQAVTPLLRHGRSILRFAKRQYSGRDTKTRLALVEYFLAHLRVCQVAGRLQGLLPGDLGDLGSASLSMRQITFILDLLMTQLIKVDDSVDALFNAGGNPLELELTARLLACAQRTYLASAEWNQWEDPVSTLISFIEEEDHPDENLSLRRDRYQERGCPADVLAKSPFMEGVLRFLFPVSTALATESCSRAERRDELLDELKRTSSGTPNGIEKKSISAALRIITMCATFFPSGCCWTSSNLENWHVLPPADCDHEHVSINSSSVGDLVLVVNVVSDVLEWCGGASGADQVQICVLRCLCSLVSSSSALVMLWKKKEGHFFENLDAAWRRVWTILFRSDLRYRSFTQCPEPRSRGELVLQLLFDITRTCSLDSLVDLINAPPSHLHSTFAYRKQNDFWDLPIFSQKEPKASHIVFRVVYAVLSIVGMVEQGNDAISIEPGIAFEYDLLWNRRSRLMFYCVKALDNEEATLETQIAASACLGALVQGHAPFLRELAIARSDLSLRRQQDQDALSDTWMAPSFQPASFVSSLPIMDSRNDSSDLARSRLTRTMTVASNGEGSSNSIPRSQVERYFKFVSSYYLKSHPTVETESVEMTNTESIEEQECNDTIATICNRLTALKVVLTVCLSGEKPLPESMADEFSERLSQCLRMVASAIADVSESKGTFLSVFRPLLGLTRGMTILAARGLVKWPAIVMEAATLLFESSDALLENSGLSTETQSSSRLGHPVPDDDGLFDESDGEDREQDAASLNACTHSEEDNSFRRKRKRRHDRESTPCKRLALGIGPPDEECKFLLASLLLALRPSYRVCELVATTLLEVDQVDDEIQDEYVNVFGAVVASTLMSTEEVLLHGNAVDNATSADPDSSCPSIVLLVCRLLAAVRSTSAPDCEFHFFGLDVCSDIVQKVDDGKLKSELSQEEARYIAELLLRTQDSTERRSLWLRPSFRAYQLHHAVVAFKCGKSNFHESFDKTFPPALVLPSLTDLNGFVRFIGGRAVAAALRILPEDRVLESVRKRLPSFFLDATEDRSSYRLWCADKSLGCDDSFKTLEIQVWEDAMGSVRYGVVNLWAEMARSSSSSQVFDSHVFDLIRLAARPDLEGLSFVTLERIALSTGHLSVESLCQACSEDILQRWIRSDNKLLNLPFVISSPFLVRRLLQGNQLSTFLNSSPSRETTDDDLRKVAETAASEFVSRHTFVILPQIMYRSVSMLVKSGVTKDYRRRFVEENYLKELCSVYDDKYDDEVVHEVLKAHLVDTFSYLAMRCISERDQFISSEIERLVKGLLGEATFFRCGQSGLHQAARRLLVLGSLGPEEGVGLFLSSARKLAHTFTPDPLQRDGGMSSLFSAKTELLVFARYLSVSRAERGRPEDAWVPFDTILAVFQEEIRRGIIDAPELKFCVQLLSTFLIDRTLRIFHPNAATSLNALARETLKLGERCRFSEVFVEILHIVFDILAQNLQSFIVHCTTSKKDFDSFHRRILGLLGSFEIEGGGRSSFWGWRTEDVQVERSSTLSTYSKNVPSEICITLEACRNLLESIIMDREQLQLADGDILGAYRASELFSFRCENLDSLHPSFGIRTWINDTFGDSEDGTTPQLRVLSLEADDLPPFLLSVKIDASDANTTSHSVDAKKTVDELKQMETFLSLLKRQGSIVRESKLRPSHLSRLCKLCSPSFPANIRLAASRCLGEMDISLIDMDAVKKEGNQVNVEQRMAVESGELLRFLQAQSIEALTISLKSVDPMLALLAVDTLKALLSTRVGSECRSLVTNEPVHSLLKQLASPNHKATQSKLCLTKGEVQLLKPKTTKFTEGDWCWDESLWNMSPDRCVPFDRWICLLVPALLICCCSSGKKDSSGSQLESAKTFYGLCQRLSALEPEFAARLFPSIVVDLLLNWDQDGNGPVCSDPVHADTWIGNPTGIIRKNLSRCFTCLLKSCTLGGEQKKDLHTKKAMNLAVETLDMLRQFTQQRFCASRNHRRNIAKKEGIPKNKASPPSKPWVGLRFGTVLNVDGLLVARACLAAGRPELSLFYAEILADCCFGSSSKAMEAITRSFPVSEAPTSGDISGYANKLSGEAAKAGDVNPGLFFGLIRDCYSQLDEPDAKEATEGFMRDLSVLSPSIEATFPCIMAEQASHLGQLDSNAQMNVRQKRKSIRAIARVLDGMGLRFTLDAYITGVMSDYQDILENGTANELSEKSLKCHLYNMAWDGLTQLNDDIATTRSGTGVSRSRALCLGKGSFYSEVLEGVVALKSDDYSTCLGHISEARKLLLSDPSLQSVHGFLGESTKRLMDRSRALNFLERVVTKNTSLSETLKFLALQKESTTHPDEAFVDLNLSLCVKEVTLRHLHLKARQSGGSLFALSQDLLLDHMWTSYYSNSTMNQTEEARGVLARIKTFIQSVTVAENADLARSSLGKLQVEEAQLLEKTGEFTAAIRSAKQVIRKLQASGRSLKTDDTVLLADALLVCGTWMTKYKVEPAHSILDSYLQPGCDLSLKVLEGCSTSQSTHRASSALLAVSELASSILDTVSSRVQSTEWLEDGRSLEQRRAELSDCTKMLLNVQTKSGKAKKGKEREWSDLCTHKIKLSREIARSEQRRHKIMESVSNHRELVLNSIVRALGLIGIESGGRPLSKYVYRMIDIWLSRRYDAADSDCIESIVAEAIERVPSFRFVQVAGQLFSRLEASARRSGKFQKNLHSLISKMCLDHPYHCLIQLITLSNGSEGNDVNVASESAVQAASELITTLKKGEVKWVSQLIESYQTLANAYIQLAMAQTEELHRGDTNRFLFTAVVKDASDRLDCCLGKRSLDVAYPPCILTKPPHIRPCCDYGDGMNDPIGSERVAGFESSFTVTDTGIHRPKIVVCIGSQGGRFRQLVKGEDDVRQDAVMQQVFGYVNQLTLSNRSSSLRSIDPSLGLVTYNIVPLGPKSGVLEWVEKSMTIFEYIVDRSSKKSGPSVGCHSRYYPGEWGHHVCKQVYQDTAEEERRKAFEEVCDHFSPCLRFFFIERFGYAADKWYEAKTRYTKSVAVNSIVGHILGIGDRHTSNILIHQGTGEIVHIDFGMVFEQAKLLRVPELVPFRLTRNIVDGMGPTGIEGVFTRTAESTLRSLRENSNALLTILSAVANDPMYAVCLNPVMARRRQEQSAAKEEEASFAVDEKGHEFSDLASKNFDGNEAAARAIAKVQEKLQGYEDGTSGDQQSVEGQVQLLVNSARDPNNLCEMYVGWAPWV